MNFSIKSVHVFNLVKLLRNRRKKKNIIKVINNETYNVTSRHLYKDKRCIAQRDGIRSDLAVESISISRISRSSSRSC